MLFRAVFGTLQRVVEMLLRSLQNPVSVAGSKIHSAEEVSNVINRHLGEGWQQQLAAPYRRQDILVQCGGRVAPFAPLSPEQNLSLNWCMGHQEVEVLDGASGYIVDG